MPCNFRQAIGCLLCLKKRLLRNDKLHSDYRDFMQSLISNNYMEIVPPSELNFPPGKGWYLVHHAVYHKSKHKIRKVFDCSLKNGGLH